MPITLVISILKLSPEYRIHTFFGTTYFRFRRNSKASRQILFFCTETDLKEAIDKIEKSTDLTYHRAGLREKHELLSLDSLLSTAVGIAEADDNNHCAGYIVVSRKDKVEIREVPHRAGGIRYAVDQQVNPHSIYFGRAAPMNRERQ